ncbi:MAG TPA: UbiD family decarboxylase, partial [Deferrimonas sp.]
MGYRNLAACIRDLEKSGGLLRIDREVDPCLEAGAIQRRVYQAGGPAILFTNVKGCGFPMLANLFGTLDRTRFLFRDTLETIARLSELKINPMACLNNPLAYLGAPRGALHLLPKRVKRAPILQHTTTLDRLPQLKSWPDDGGAFITLPQVYSESVLRPGVRRSNLG